MPNNKKSLNENRRDFMKQSSLLAGGLIAAPLLSNANFYSGSSDVIKVALIGCGGRGTGAATQALLSKQNIKIVAMADAFRDRIDRSYKELTADDMSDSGIKGNFKAMIDVPEERICRI